MKGKKAERKESRGRESREGKGEREGRVVMGRWKMADDPMAGVQVGGLMRGMPRSLREEELTKKEQKKMKETK